VFSFFIALPLAVCLQAPQPAISGMVIDITGASVANAEIKVLTSDSHSTIANARSDKAGKFEAGPLQSGSYTVTARAPGFRLRVWNGVAIREGEIRNLGKLQLDIADCDAPGVMCDTFTAEPVFPGLILQSELSMKLNCGADLVKGHSSCPGDDRADFKVVKDGSAVYLLPAEKIILYVPHSPFSGCKNAAGDAKIRIDGYGPGLDFCVVRHDRRVSHAYLSSEVDANTTEVRIWFTTTREK
jgi:hypothetical protein